MTMPVHLSVRPSICCQLRMWPPLITACTETTQLIIMKIQDNVGTVKVDNWMKYYDTYWQLLALRFVQ